jgi:Arc/MetJ-type ribon-helix-helix transcriptional regulator
MGQGTQQLRRKFSVELPFADFEKLVQIRNSGKYASYSDFFRTAIRNENVKEKK